MSVRPRLRRATKLMPLVLALSLFASTDAGANRLSTTYRSVAHSAALHSSVSARSYVTSLFSRIPLPSIATQLGTPIKALQPVSGSLGFRQVAQVTKYYLLPASFSVGGFAKSHFAPSEFQGAASTSDGGSYRVSYTYSALALCRDRHASYCSVTYSTTTISGARQELRVDVVVVWLPVHTIYLPMTGVVTLTGYEKLSLMNASSGPVVVTLNAPQVKRLRGAIARLRTSPGAMCMEDSTLYKITVTDGSDGKVFWSAIADECPGALSVSTKGVQIALNSRSCPLEALVSTFFPATKAQGTKSGLKVCNPSG